MLVQNNRLEATLNKFKLDPRYLGPYEVESKTKRGNYILKELDGTIHSEPYAAFRLFTYINRHDPIFDELLEDPLAEDQNDEEEADIQQDPEEQSENSHATDSDSDMAFF